MKELIIQIPEWAEPLNIRVFAGLELLASKPAGQDRLFIKSSRCNQCGDCCRNIKGDFPPQTDGICNYLVGNKCGLGTTRPFSCGFEVHYPDCPEQFE